MGYQALLFCPDEKTARAVTQVLSELEFSVEPCTEPFAAVKKLMAQHFDAVVVDCDNEQNATLLFKSARNSTSNQSSLAVAVVEGQAGVAKAFRIGANLVLTKPINIEQAKGTLRVARGLLRKGGEPGKSVSATAAPSAPASSVPPATVSQPRPAAAPAKPAFSAIPAAKVAIPKSAPAAAGQSSKSEPAIAALSEVTGSAKAAEPSSSAPSAGSTGAFKKSYPWQPAKPGVEPMASALRKAAEAAGVSETSGAKPAEATSAKGPDKSMAAGSTTAHGAASAPAPAKEKSPEELPLITPATKNAPAPFEKAAAPKEVERTREEKPSSEVAPPSFSMGAPAFDEEEPANNKKALLIVAGVVLLASLAGYLGWRNMSSKSSPATSNPAATAPASTGSASPATDSTKSPDASATGTPAEHATESAPAPAVSKPSPAAKSTTHEAPASRKDQIAPDTTVTTPAPAAPAPAAPAIVVKNERSRSAAKSAAPDSDQAVAPSAIGVATDADTKALAAISNAPVSVPKASGDLVKISQGVSEGLILKRVSPRYPPQALQLRKEGTVLLQATVTKDGNISNVKVLSGDSMLAHAAEDAVRQWKYKPYYLNGEPVDILTQITVNFRLPR